MERRRRQSLDLGRERLIGRRTPRETTLSDAPENLAGERLLRAIDTIDEDVALIELWACALSGFAQPAPDYGLGDKDLGDKDLGDKFRRDGERNEVPEAA